MGSNRASRRDREIERHRIEIMAAAEQLFAQKGYVSSSMDEVARRAEFSVGTLYNFFKNKEALYSAILQHKSELMQVRIEACLARPGSPAEKIEAYFSERMDLYWRYPNFFRLFFHQAMSAVSDPRAGFTRELGERYELLLRGLDAIFEAGIARGEFRRGIGDHPDDIAGGHHPRLPGSVEPGGPGDTLEGRRSSAV
jgi:TetR/AcrR family transcriptional regulator